MPFKSTFPDVEIPNVGIWDFLFENKQREFPDDQVILLDPYSKRSYTYTQLKKAATDFGKGLKSLWEFEKGDVLNLFTPNSIDTPAVMWGAHFAGAIVSPANPGYTAAELVHQLKDSGAKGIVTQMSVLPIALEATEKVGIPVDRICLIGEDKHPEALVKPFTKVLNYAGTSRYRRAKVDPDNDLAFLVYSSGTTGLPKGVMLSHRNIIADVLMNEALETPLHWKNDSVLAFLPFFHIYGLTVILHQFIHRGIKIVVMPKFDLHGWCKIVQDHKITTSFVVPPVVLGLAKDPGVSNFDLSSLRMMTCGAAPLTKELLEQEYARLKIPIKQGYGLSETSPTTHTQTWDDWNATVGSVGHLLPNQTAKYMSEDEKEVAAGEVGELWIKGPNVFKGYLNNAAGTAHCMTSDGYFKTGDVGYQDSKGNFYITDRVKELIKYKGFQVPPAELEGLLASHEKIADVAVLGVFREELATEVPLAYIVPAAGVEPSPKLEAELTGWLAERVASHKKLRGGVRFTKEIPKSASGKILRRLLKVRYAEEEAKKAGKAKL